LAVKIDRLHHLHGLYGPGLVEGWKPQKPTFGNVVKGTLEQDRKIRPPLFIGALTNDVQKKDRPSPRLVGSPQKQAVQPTMVAEIVAITLNDPHNLVGLG
jgi:hypothetical protein